MAAIGAAARYVKVGRKRYAVTVAERHLRMCRLSLCGKTLSHSAVRVRLSMSLSFFVATVAVVRTRSKEQAQRRHRNISLCVHITSDRMVL